MISDTQPKQKPQLNPKTKVIFFAGTDTDVGKTYIAALAAKSFRESGLRVGVYKPVASDCRDKDGVRIASDAVALWEAAGRPRTLNEVCPQRFLAPLAPNEAARAENTSVDAQAMIDGLKVWTDADFDVCIVEGAGGLMSPLADSILNIDFAKQIAADAVILVSANRLGTIHQTLATIAAAKQGSISLSGIVLNQASDEVHDSCLSNAKQIEGFGDVPILNEVPFGGQLDISGWQF
ncbi:ATP-dependent dethiobiotin synthetase BioD 1 [Rubripirellula obstinata]|uniref:ATP-dependent dethiobiotin synthetase BioD n=1 Tax=Rubripirellula obstinata TaxID=406547 RepID=A0A5B1CEV0_9BACT|nr:dethiobiotin synthase [Rubripirellula obstinata]KAA1259687.1 ATP-dependent dethiobiotin synthetase BioD 1 [Rubripirellula obstinata]